MSKKKLRAFISSRSDEFASERLILVEALKKAHIEPIIFEDYGAENSWMEKSNKDDIIDCDIFIGIYGYKFSKPTKQEFNLAIELKKSCLFYLKSYNVEVGIEEDMKEFITQIKSKKKIYRYFQNIIKLKEMVLEDILSEAYKSLIIYKYKLSDILQKHTDNILKISHDYSDFRRFIKNHSTDTKIVGITETNGDSKIIINKGLNHNLFENIEFNVKHGDKVISRIQVESVQEEMSLCIPIDKFMIISKNKFEMIYTNCSLEVIDLTESDFIHKMMVGIR